MLSACNSSEHPAVPVSSAAVTLPALEKTPAAPDRGNSIVVTFRDDLPTLDPALGYDWKNWSVIKSVFDGLLDYKPGTTELVPDLAESYTVSPDGLTYIFKLRHGVTFHNGREMKAADVTYSLTRMIYPGTMSPGAGYYLNIKGAQQFTGGSANAISGITAPDDYTVKIELDAPDATTLQLLALNFAYIVPKEEVEQAGNDFGHNPVGTGAFKVTSWIPDEKIVLERNAAYHKKGLPRLDKIVFGIGVHPVDALKRLQSGEIDIAGDNVPPALYSKFVLDPATRDLVTATDQLQTAFIAMNVNMPPFDKPGVRQAVNMAIDKRRIVELIDNRAVVANQVLPPAMPGHDKSYKGFAYDVAAAKAKMREAGFGEGVDTELYVMNVAPQPLIAGAIQQDLAAIGIRAEIKSVDMGSIISRGGSSVGAPMIWSGGLAWIADFPDPSNFYTAILGCGGAVDGGWNWSWYCNNDLQQRAAEANAISDPAKTAKRTDLWRGIFADVMADAPWVPVFYEKAIGIHSPRVTGPNGALDDPLHVPANYDEIYVMDGS
ncbi:MAG: ABC transporter substrate-binding protein [Proteobacteria bacterium]|nr:ABC transporter substrate-binding protein [Pseudomonadota bacterium]